MEGRGACKKRKLVTTHIDLTVKPKFLPLGKTPSVE